MQKSMRLVVCATVAAIAGATAIGLAQRGAGLAPDAAARRWETEKELLSLAVVKVTLQPLTTSNYFAPGHRLRIEVSSSNFPRFDRNLNTGGRNYDETQGVIAHNVIHHSKQYPSKVTVTVVKR